MINLYANDYKGCKVYFYELEHDSLIAETTIIDYDKASLIITVNGEIPNLEVNQRISLLILCKDSPLEYQGTTRKRNNANNWQIAMFQGRKKEDRHSVRYTINAPAKIEKLITANLTVPVKTSADTKIVNISTNGMLIRTTLHLLNIGTCFQIKLNVSENNTILTACVERVHNILGPEVEYGCRLIKKA